MDHQKCVDFLRNIFASDTCQCGNPKKKHPKVLLCKTCMKKLPEDLQTALDEIESAGALKHFYDEALAIINTDATTN